MCMCKRHIFQTKCNFYTCTFGWKCRRDILLKLFGEDSVATACPEYCCDVCEVPAVYKKTELSLLIQTVDKLRNTGEVTEWVWGDETAWMQQRVKGDPSTYEKSPPKNGGEYLFDRLLLLAFFYNLLNQQL